VHVAGSRLKLRRDSTDDFVSGSELSGQDHDPPRVRRALRRGRLVPPGVVLIAVTVDPAENTLLKRRR